MHDRRQFIGAALGAGAALLAPRLARAAESRIEVIPAEPIGTIAPEIYGHFVEHLGGVVYDGIWVGEGSSIPNVGGIRKEIVDRLRQIRASVVRWPGGCFADQYDWRDGTGPRASRPRRTNFWVDVGEWPAAAAGNGPQRFEPNQFGTVEFARFCRLAGAQPYFAANVRSLSPQDFWRWVEYCNAPAGTTTTADQRAADGEREPLGVRFWGVGNESWGCGGNFTPEEYAAAFRRYTAWLPWGGKLSLIGAGPNSGDLDWTRRFFAAAEGRGRQHLWGWALHHYSWNVSGGRTTGWREGKGDALQFDPEQHYEILAEADKMESLVTGHWKAMGETDAQHRVKLVVDEWGAWHKPGTEPFAEALLGQQNTMRDALLAGQTLDTFQRHADKVAMANVAQLVNCLQSLFLAHEDRFCVTPTYHVFDLYAAHQGAQAVRAVFSAPRVSYTRNGQPASLNGLNGSASLKDRRLVLTVTNPSLDAPRETEVAVRGGSVRSVRMSELAALDVHAHNTFASPAAVAPKARAVEGGGAGFVHRFPPASVTRLEMELAS
jgi:alpha-N-arabinofuranosidase